MLQPVIVDEHICTAPGAAISIPVQSHLDVHVGGTEDGDHFIVFTHRVTGEPLAHLCRDANGDGWVTLMASDWSKPALRAAELSDLLTMTRSVI